MRTSKRPGQPSSTTGRAIRERRRESAEGKPRRRSQSAERSAAAVEAVARGRARRAEQPAAVAQRGGRRPAAGGTKQQQQQQRRPFGAASARGSRSDGDTAAAEPDDGPSKRSLCRARKRKFRNAEQAFTLLAGHDACVQLVLSGACKPARAPSIARSTLIKRLAHLFFPCDR
jgi:hypothetical protein